MGVSRQWVDQLENRDYYSKDQSEKISQALGINEEWLRTGHGAMFRPGFEVEEYKKGISESRLAENKAPYRKGCQSHTPHKRNINPAITINKGGIILNRKVMEKLGDSGYIAMYTEKGEGTGLLIKAAKEDELGAKKLSFNSSWKIISAEYRKGAEEKIGFPVKNKSYRVIGEWMVDGDDEFWHFDMSTAEEVKKYVHLR